MISQSGRYVIIFNGEIYNFLDLKRKYFAQDYNFKSTSDTEVLLGLIEKYGVYETVNKMNGMYAFALYDLKLQKLFYQEIQQVKSLYITIKIRTVSFFPQN